MLPTTLSNIEANRLGFFILPNEEQKAYKTRLCAYLKQVTLNSEAHKGARRLVQTLYDIDPQWVPITYTKKGLYPWEAACSWADEIPSIQLHPSFEKKTHLFGFYNKDEILAHEYVHACRAHLDSNAYEELFAYLVSLHTTKGCKRIFSYIRAFFGPLFSSPQEALTFMLVSFLTTAFAGICLFIEEPSYVLWGLFFLAAFAFLSLLVFWFLRLFVRLSRWMRCYKMLQAKNIAALKLMVRLTDAEIDAISRMTQGSFALWHAKVREEFRWGFLFSLYSH